METVLARVYRHDVRCPDCGSNWMRKDGLSSGKLMEAIIESVDEFYSENLAEEVKQGMREAA